MGESDKSTKAAELARSQETVVAISRFRQHLLDSPFMKYAK
jgi:hypothetical protein